MGIGRYQWKSIAIFVAIAALVIITFVLWGEQIESWFDRAIDSAQGNPIATAWILFAALSSDIVLPVPSSIASTLCGAALGFWKGFAVSFGAMSVSAAAGYALGYFCSGFAAKRIGKKETEYLAAFSEGRGRWLLLALRPVPVLAEASALFAGISRKPAASAAVELLIGNAVVSAVYSAAGAYGKADGSMLPAFAGTMIFSGALMLAANYFGKKKRGVKCSQD